VFDEVAVVVVIKRNVNVAVEVAIVGHHRHRSYLRTYGHCWRRSDAVVYLVKGEGGVVVGGAIEGLVPQGELIPRYQAAGAEEAAETVDVVDPVSCTHHQVIVVEVGLTPCALRTK